MKVLVFGHSIVQGFWDTEGGWVHRLSAALDTLRIESPDEHYYEVFNLGIAGNDSNQLLERVDDETERRVDDDDAVVVLFQIGANDIQWLNDEQRVRVPAERFEANIEALLRKSRRIADEVVFVGEAYTSIDGPIPWAPDLALSDERLREYHEITRTVCSREDVSYVDIRSTYDRGEWGQMLDDGCHPNTDGHRAIFREVRRTLNEDDIIEPTGTAR